ncbi:RNA polymerase sigma factor [Kribbella sp. NPDC026611]|uniref:RNA polymerase sigma factor n=1 Tax=Kribbella sp. NPDC026611 TaxID=3154911 RepID=UPI0033CD0D25
MSPRLLGVTMPQRPNGPGQVVGTDRALWERLRLADEEALSELFHRHSDAVYNFAFRRTASWSQAEDVVQAMFTTLWRRARTGRVDELQLDSARPLLLVMAGYECGNALRTTRRQAALQQRIELVDAGGTAEPDHSAATAARVDDERAMSDIRRIVDRLPAKQREVVELVIWSECSMSEAARALSIPEGTVKSRLARARTTLAGLLDLGPEGQS